MRIMLDVRRKNKNRLKINIILINNFTLKAVCCIKQLQNYVIIVINNMVNNFETDCTNLFY